MLQLWVNSGTACDDVGQEPASRIRRCVCHHR